MESLGVVLLLTVIPGQTGQDEVQVEAGVDATLDCQGPTEGTITVLAWNKRGMKSDDYVFFYREDRSYKAYQHPSFKGRVELGDPQLKGGNMSIILHNTTDNDTGTYECHISYQSGSGRDKRVTPEIKHETRLTVVPAGQTGGQKKNEDNKDGGKEDTGKEDGSVGLIVGLVVSSVFLVAAAAGFLIYMKLQAYPCQNSYQPSGELQQV